MREDGKWDVLEVVVGGKEEREAVILESISTGVNRKGNLLSDPNSLRKSFH